MTDRGQAPIVRHSYATDPDPAKVAAALALWRRALADRMALMSAPPRVAEPPPIAQEPGLF